MEAVVLLTQYDWLLFRNGGIVAALILIALELPALLLARRFTHQWSQGLGDPRQRKIVSIRVYAICLAVYAFVAPLVLSALSILRYGTPIPFGQLIQEGGASPQVLLLTYQLLSVLPWLAGAAFLLTFADAGLRSRPEHMR